MENRDVSAEKTIDGLLKEIQELNDENSVLREQLDAQQDKITNLMEQLEEAITMLNEIKRLADL